MLNLIVIGRKSSVRTLILGSLSVERLGMGMMLKILYRQGCRATLVGSNEDSKLKLPKAWKPLDRT